MNLEHFHRSPQGAAADRHDRGKLVNARSRETGFAVGRYLQTPPMLFTRDGHNVFLGDMYRGCTAFLICSGPSLLTHDLSQLNNRGILTYSVNNAATIVRTHLWSCVDDPGNFVDAIWRDPGITKLVPFAHFEKRFMVRDEQQLLVPSQEVVGDMPAVFGFRRNETFNPSQWLHEDTFNWGNHSKLVDERGNKGSRSVMYVALRMLFYLGIRQVFLLGCDFRMELGKQNYAFPQDRSPGSVRGNNSSYRILNARLEQLLPYFEREGFVVRNCTPGSGLTVFPFVPFEEAVKEAVLSDKIVTDGMYDRAARQPKVLPPPSPEKPAHQQPVSTHLPPKLQPVSELNNVENSPPQNAVQQISPVTNDAPADHRTVTGSKSPSLSDITLITVVDKSFAPFLDLAWQTWQKNKAGFTELPTIVFFDPAINPRSALPSLLKPESSVTFMAWPRSAAVSHRARFLSAWMTDIQATVRTPWFCRIDADVLAITSQSWLLPEWFANDWQYRSPAYIAHSVSLGDCLPSVTELNGWANGVPELRKLPPLEIPPFKPRVREQAIRSATWLWLAQTAWMGELEQLLKQGNGEDRADTHLFYGAARRNDYRVSLSMTQHGWTCHYGQWRTFAAQAEQILLQPAALTSQ